MTHVTIADQVRVEADAARVWDAIKDPREHAGWHPFVTEIRGEHRLGEPRACSVLVGKKAGTTRERCVAEEPQRLIEWAIDEDTTGFSRMVRAWRAGFWLEPNGSSTLVSARSMFEPRSVLVRAMVPIIRPRFHQTQRSILAGLKGSLEGDAGT